MSWVSYRTVETPTGRGRISFRQEVVCDTGYRLEVVQEVVDGPRISASKEEAMGHRKITGNLTGREDWSELFDGEVRTLELSDGRHLDFILKDPSEGTIQGTGDFYGPANPNS